MLSVVTRRGASGARISTFVLDPKTFQAYWFKHGLKPLMESFNFSFKLAYHNGFVEGSQIRLHQGGNQKDVVLANVAPKQETIR